MRGAHVRRASTDSVCAPGGLLVARGQPTGGSRAAYWRLPSGPCDASQREAFPRGVCPVLPAPHCLLHPSTPSLQPATASLQHAGGGLQ
eukprot:807228-Prymnesium_polylepis.1